MPLALSRVLWIITGLSVAFVVEQTTDAAPPTSMELQASKWKGYTKQAFALDGCRAFVVEPQIAAPGKPWVWRTSFPDFHAEVDLELLRNGYHVAHIDCLNMLGSDLALDRMDRFYSAVRQKWGLAEKPALEAVSRGGLHAYRYAARHPERIACIYADTPVMDFKSWPRKRADAKKNWTLILKHYAFANEQAALAYKGNPIDQLAPIAKAKIPLRHVISLNDKVVPPEENTLEAKRRLQALGSDMEIVTVKEGNACDGHHFPLIEVFQSAHFIMKHAHVLPKGIEYFNLRTGLANCKARFDREKAGRVAFLGGSITFNPGWRDALMRYLQQRFPETKFDFIAAGIPSLGSVPHAFRLERDVLSRGPVDLLFVEAAVNDHNYDGLANSAELALRGMEGVVRHARAANLMTDIVVMHFVSPSDLTDYNSGKVPYPIAQHERVATHYGCPSLNLALEVNDRINAKEFTWTADFRDLHPSPYGQRVYANSMIRMLDAAFAQSASPKSRVLPEKPLDERSYARGRYGKPSDARIAKGFKLDPNWNPRDGVATRDGFVNVPALVGTQPGDEFEFDFDGVGCGLLLAAGPRSGVIEFSADGGAFKKVDTYSRWSGSLYLPWAVILDDNLKAGKHTVKVRIASDHNPRGKGTDICVIYLLLN